jgi:hypothetical protein
MRNLIYVFAACALLAAACKKSRHNTPKPVLERRSLQDIEVSYLHPQFINIDGDTTHDVYFVVALINDTEGVHAKFTAYSVKHTKLLSRPDSVIKLAKGDAIPVIPEHPREWNGYDTYLCEILLPAGNPADTTWRGDWVAAKRKYMGVQFLNGGEPYLGWIAVSVDTARDCMILHEAAWRKASAGNIHAGDLE